MNYITFPDCTPSPMESYIILKLRKAKVDFVREISFKGLINPKTNQNLRYDFYVPHFNLIIEYDGKEFHTSQEVKERDAIKDNFAKDKCIRMYRISGGKPRIDEFFNSNFWKSQIKRLPQHKNVTNRKRKKTVVVETIVVIEPPKVPQTQSEMREKVQLYSIKRRQ